MSGDNGRPPAHRERPGTITSLHRYELPLPPETVWGLISEVGDYPRWWSWLRACDADALAAGEEWRCEVQPPLPYPLRFRVLIDEVKSARLVQARVEGDVVGDATLELQESDEGCMASLRSSLAPGNSALRLMSRFAAPLARYGHDWVLDSGARQFIARAVRPVPGD
jgi:uncharacterized protein YndB with AHSA1/START domain